MLFLTMRGLYPSDLSNRGHIQYDQLVIQIHCVGPEGGTAGTVYGSNDVYFLGVPSFTFLKFLFFIFLVLFLCQFMNRWNDVVQHSDVTRARLRALT